MKRVLLGTLASLVFAAPAAAAPGWLDGWLIVDTAAGGAGAAMTPDGTVIASTVPSGTTINEVRTRKPGGDFGGPAQIPNATGCPALAVGADGTVALAYLDGGTSKIAIRLPGGNFGTPADFLPAAVCVGQNLLVDGAGRVWAAAESSIHVRDTDGTVTSFPVGSGGVIESLGLRALPGGGVRTVHRESKVTDTGGGACTLDTAIRTTDVSADKVASPSEDIVTATFTGTLMVTSCVGPGTGTIVHEPGMAISPTGTTVATYRRRTTDGGNITDGRVVARVRPPGTTWAAASEETISAETDQVSHGVVFAADTPVALISSSADNNVGIAQRAAGGTWGTPDFQNGVQIPLFEGSPSGTVIVMALKSGNVLRAWSRLPAGTMTPAVDISLGGANPIGLDTDHAGNGFAMWARDIDPGAGTVLAVELARYDGAGPKVTVTGASSGAPGQTLLFEAKAVDVWSDIPAPPAWLFGDSATGNGTAVTHAYAAEGTFTVTATATDSRGLAGSDTQDVQVSGSPVPTSTPTPSPTATATATASPTATATASPTASPTATPDAAPQLTGLTASVRRRRVTLRFTASEPVSVAVRIKRRGGRATTLTRVVAGGAQSIRTGRLRAGRYTFTLVGTDSANQQSAPAVVRKRVRA